MTHSRTGLLLAVLTLSVSVALTAFSTAAEIPIVAVEAFHQGDSFDGDGSILDTFNGTGMNKFDPDDPSTWTISSTAWQDDWQGFGTPTNATSTWAVIDLGAPATDLKTMYLWNVQENNALNRGTREFNVFHATAPTVAPPPTSGTVTPYDFASGGWTALGGSTLAQGTQIGDTGQSYDLSAAAGARYVGIQIISNHGGTRSGLAEIAFSDLADANAITLQGEVEPPDPADDPSIPITGLFGFHQGDTADGDGSILRIADTTITKVNIKDPTTWTHSNIWQDDWQGFEVPGVTPNGTWVVLDLGAPVNNLGALLLWNVNEGTASDRGTNEFRLHHATSPTIQPPGATGTPTAYDFSSGGWTAFGDVRTLAQASANPGEPVNGNYDLSGMPAARYIGIEILSNHGGFRVGLAQAVLLPRDGPPPLFRIVEIDLAEQAQDRIRITWDSLPGQVYQVAFSTDLKSWLELSDDELGAADSETTSFLDERAAISELTRVYYRVAVIPNP